MRRLTAVAAAFLLISAGACTSGLDPTEFRECVLEIASEFIVLDEQEIGERMAEACPPNGRTLELLRDPEYQEALAALVTMEALFG